MANERASSVWDVLADTPQEAENLRVRSQLMRAIKRVISAWNVLQKEAAQRLQLTQPRLNDLLRGRIDTFSLDALVNILASADLEDAVKP